MPQECANAFVQLRTDDVFEFAGLRMRLGIVDGKGIFEEALGQPVAADYIASPLATHGRELHLAIL
jgi:hypothetical protein